MSPTAPIGSSRLALSRSTIQSFEPMAEVFGPQGTNLYKVDPITHVRKPEIYPQRFAWWKFGQSGTASVSTCLKGSSLEVVSLNPSNVGPPSSVHHPYFVSMGDC